VSGLLGFLKSFGAPGFGAAEVRAEAWALGGRHFGQVVEGARAELRAPDISAKRAGLLRAVIRSRQQ
jgi:hypothetical protein